MSIDIDELRWLEAGKREGENVSITAGELRALLKDAAEAAGHRAALASFRAGGFCPSCGRQNQNQVKR